MWPYLLKSKTKFRDRLLPNHHLARMLISSLYAVSSPIEIRPTTVLSSANLKIALEVCDEVRPDIHKKNRGLSPGEELVLSRMVITD